MKVVFIGKVSTKLRLKTWTSRGEKNHEKSLFHKELGI